MRFQVPQFIEVEDKIFGPFTGKQFVYLAGGGGIAFVLWALLPNFLAILIAAPIVGFTLALAFYKINNRPFIYVLQSAFNYSLRNKLYIWHKQDREPTSKSRMINERESLLQVPKLSQSKLKDIAWSLDIKESMYSNPAQRGNTSPETYGNKLEL
ncbi:MAG TPA: PrgI family protein [Candidatus Paceibacterota bacterium]|jgi:hypothetical protein